MAGMIHVNRVCGFLFPLYEELLHPQEAEESERSLRLLGCLLVAPATCFFWVYLVIQYTPRVIPRAVSSI